MREKAGEISLCGNVREKRAKCGSLPPNAGGLATMNTHTHARARTRVQAKTNLSSIPFALLNNNCKNHGTSMMNCPRAPFQRISSSSTSPRLVTFNSS